MSSPQGSTLVGLLKLAMVSSTDLPQRLRALAELAKGAAQEGDSAFCAQTLECAVQSLGTAGTAHVDAESVAGEAFAVGRLGEELDLPQIARDAYFIAANTLDPDREKAELATVWRDIADTWRSDGEPERALEAYAASVDFCEEVEDYGGSFIGLCSIAKLQRDGASGSAKATLRRASAALGSAGVMNQQDSKKVAQTAVAAGKLARQLDASDLARDIWIGATAILRYAEHGEELGILWYSVGRSWREDGELARAAAAYRKGADAEIDGDAVSRILTLNALLETEAELGPCEGTDASLQEALAVLAGADSFELEERAELASTAHSLGRVSARLKRHPEAREAYGIAIRMLDAEGDEYSRGVTWHDIGDSWRAEKAYREACAAFKEADQLKATGGDTSERLYTRRALIVSLADAGRLDDARDACAEAVWLASVPPSSSTERNALADEISHLATLAKDLDRADLAQTAALLLVALRGEGPGDNVRWSGW